MIKNEEVVNDSLWPRDKNLASRLRLLRKERHMTQEEVASALALQRSTYAYYETGRTMPKLGNLIRMAEFFGVTTDFLIGKSDRRGGSED